MSILTLESLPTAHRNWLGVAVGAVLAIFLLGCGADSSPKSMSTRDPGPLSSPTPLHPKQILEGTPETHTTDIYQSSNGKLFVAYWSASAGRFTWDYTDINEVITILEGEAFVKTSDQVTHHLTPGMTLVFGEGEFAEWRVPQYVRKLAVVQSAPRTFLQRVRDKLEKLMGSES